MNTNHPLFVLVVIFLLTPTLSHAGDDSPCLTRAEEEVSKNSGNKVTFHFIMANSPECFSETENQNSPNGGTDTQPDFRGHIRYSTLVDSLEKKSWRNNEFGCWIPTKTPIPNNYSIHSVSASGPMDYTVMWDDYWNPFYSLQEDNNGAFPHTIDFQLLATSDNIEPEVVCRFMEITYELLHEIKCGKWWLASEPQTKDNASGLIDASQNPPFYDEILRRLEKEIPESPIVDIYVEKIGVDISFY